MVSHLHPGVYIEEIPSGVKPIEGSATSIVALVGAAVRGPIGSPVLVHSFDEYVREFGPLSVSGDSMGLAAAAYYGNGGKDAYVMRLAAQGASAASCDLLADDETKSQVLTVTARSPGAWGNDVWVEVTKQDGTFTLAVGRQETNPKGELEFKAEEIFPNLTMTPNDERYAVSSVKDRSRIVMLSAGDATLIPGKVTQKLARGAAAPPTQAEYISAFRELKKIRDISVVLLPGQSATTAGKPFIDLAVNHCEETGNRMVIIDPPESTELTNAAAVDDLKLPTSTYAVCYYPWLKVANPLPNSAANAATISVAPSAYAAGIWARTDGRRGVWKAPAGVEASLLGVASPAFNVGEADQDQLNPRGINCIRVMPGFGAVVWGARTLATRANPEWRYVPVRRTAIMIEESIYNGIQWAVFEPNDQNLWSSLRLNIESFMNGLFRAGAFQGAKASDAYFVRCGLGDTMTQGDIDAGQVIVIVGFAPLKPAEFVIVRIQQKLQQ